MIFKSAKWLGLAEQPRELQKLKDFDVEFSDEIKSVTTEINITARSLAAGNRLMDLPLPDKTLAVMVKRDNKFFVPKGKTVLHENDKVLIITDDHEALMQTIQNLENAGATVQPQPLG